ncbi:MAG: lysoplasmalogenase [Lutibacter sp.]|uniref:lysoplasmalogenase n=1 Tax=Lutibacter sp. TaxID=1925666 RepID=UPI00299E8E6A|nr:lysoplasmalogenase [Lutibacter sp.]MDX1829198.1 lysoplasmalogenase [Lutibacter sp.]
MNKIKLTFLLFLFASVMDIIGIILKTPMLIYVFKPLIIIALLFLYVFSLPKRLKWYVIALEFSFFGDVLLMFSGKLFFMAGLLSFLMAHILFIKIVINQIKKTSILKVIIASVPFLMLFLGLMFVLRNSLNELLIPVIIYGLTISTFGVVSLINYLQKKSVKSFLMLVGAVVFITSDSLLAINKFYNPNKIFEVLIMVTYIVAQYLIFKSMVLSPKKVKS